LSSRLHCVCTCGGDSLRTEAGRDPLCRFMSSYRFQGYVLRVTHRSRIRGPARPTSGSVMCSRSAELPGSVLLRARMRSLLRAFGTGAEVDSLDLRVMALDYHQRSAQARGAAEIRRCPSSCAERDPRGPQPERQAGFGPILDLQGRSRHGSRHRTLPRWRTSRDIRRISAHFPVG
jgi:hypothetical protein